MSLALISIALTSCFKKTEPNNQNNPLSDKIALRGSLTADRSLDASAEYVLEGPLYVKSGTTLRIPAGTVIEALPGGTDVFILVERGGRIVAEGTFADPVVFTSAADNPASGDWGGIIINGSAPISGTSSGTEAATEVRNDLMYGGSNPNDDSGVLTYVMIEYTGARIDSEAEHNGLTLNGVGNGTLIENIMIANGDDDGIEFFGGNVDVTNLLVVNAKDDMFDFTQGYKGTVTNAYGVREAGYLAVTSDPRGVEADGNLDGKGPGHVDQADFVIDGMTIVNKSTAEMPDAIKVRRGATADIRNARVISMADQNYGDLVDLRDSRGDATMLTAVSVARLGDALVNAAIKHPEAGEAAVVENQDNSGADTDAFAWTNYNF